MLKMKKRMGKEMRKNLSILKWEWDSVYSSTFSMKN
jgi:hypothetical protein